MNRFAWTIGFGAASAIGLMPAVLVEAQARPQLAITELWPGGLPGEEATSDWLEVTNVGDSVFDAWSTIRAREGVIAETLPEGLAVSGGVFVGVGALAPGESAVFLTAYDAEFFDAWSPSAPRVFNPAGFDEAGEAFVATWGPGVGGLRLGAIDDSSTGEPWQGFSGGGETVSIYAADDGTTFETGVITLLDAVTYPASDPASWAFAPEPTAESTPRTGSLSEVGVGGAFVGVNPANGFLNPALTVGQPPIGSPGVVPEPAAALLLASSLLFRRPSNALASMTPPLRRLRP